MTALARLSDTTTRFQTRGARDLAQGDDTGLFISASDPPGGDMLCGEGAGLFIQSVLGDCESLSEGGQTGLFIQSV